MSVEDLERLIAAGAPLADLLQALRPEGHEEVLERLALVRTFDREIYDLLMVDVPQAPPLDELASTSQLEALPGHEALYRLADSLRRGRVDALRTRGEPFTRLSAQLVDAYEKRGNELEALHHLVAVDSDSAMERFRSHFADADGQFDLPRCRDLLSAMADRTVLLRADQCEELDDYERYVGARSQWIEDWYRTARFVGSEANVAALDRLLTGREARALLLWARGGMGKTMHLRWFIARRCVPRPQRVPCARIDFDFLEPRTAAREPWLLLLEMAAQLDPQLPRRPFGELLVQYGHHRERLELRGSNAADPVVNARSRRPETLEPDAVNDLRERFVAVLRDLPPDQRLLLVIDTLEVALLPGGIERGQGSLVPLLAELARVHDAAKCVRLVLAGRYELATRAPDIAVLLPTAEDLQLTEFGPEEVRGYLCQARGIDRPDLVEAVRSVSGGVPLKVAMIADVLEHEPTIPLSELRDYTDAAYVIERVLRRIEPPLRWLVWYGAIARRLDLELLNKVILPRVLEAIDDDGVPDAQALWASLKA